MIERPRETARDSKGDSRYVRNRSNTHWYATSVRNSRKFREGSGTTADRAFVSATKSMNRARGHQENRYHPPPIATLLRAR